MAGGMLQLIYSDELEKYFLPTLKCSLCGNLADNDVFHIYCEIKLIKKLNKYFYNDLIDIILKQLGSTREIIKYSKT